ncbi:TetR/AcrR family transcriptional regulator [Corynebacterium propinquum]
MPKKVDHGKRRQELIESTWTVIARRGLANTTMREIAKQAGYANGALKPYFPNKADLLEATYSYVYAQTEARIDEATQGTKGVAALRSLCLEVLPISELLLDEAYVVVAFWDAASRNKQQSQLISDSLAQWRGRIEKLLCEGKQVGAVRGDLDIPAFTGVFLSFLHGAQVTAINDPESFSPARMKDQLESLLKLLSP